MSHHDYIHPNQQPEQSGAFAPGWGMTRHPKLGAVERRTALLVNFFTSRSLQNLRRSGALQGAVR